MITFRNGKITSGFHRTPAGQIREVYGMSQNSAHWRDDNERSGLAPLDEYTTWTHLPELRDFPNAKDPELPYSFDLFWDYHTLGQMMRDVEEGTFDLNDPDVRELLEQHKIDPYNPQTVRDYNTRYAQERKKALDKQAGGKPKGRRNGSR